MIRPRKLLLFALVIALAESSTSASALAYAIGGNPWPPDGWPAGVPCNATCKGQPVTLRYSFTNMFDGGMLQPDGNPLPNLVIRQSIEEALGLWTSVTPITFVEVADFSPAQFRFNHVRIDGSDLDPPPALRAKAQSTCIGASTSCVVQFDDNDRWQEVGTIPLPDILGAAIHEIGHILGLQHSQVNGANMYSTFHRTLGLGTGQLYPDDIAGIQVLYGAAAPEPSTWLMTATALLSAWPFVRRNRSRRVLARQPLSIRATR